MTSTRATSESTAHDQAVPAADGLDERALIERIRSRVPPAAQAVLIGIGDDAAVVEPERNELQVLTTDALIEDVHFDRAFVTPREIGAKAIAVNLSDIAAMGATPGVALLSLALPPRTPVRDVDDLIDGLLETATRFRLDLVGGNISRSPGPLIVDVTIVGSVRPRRVLTRSGGRPGDSLYVSGSLGEAAAGLDALRLHGREVLDSSSYAECARRYLLPEPRLRLGTLLARNRVARCAVDLSDGLGDGVHQVASASGLGATVEADAIPVAACARAWFESRRVDPLEAALTGGEDYELLFSVPSRSHKTLRNVERLSGSLPLTRIGSLTADKKIILRRGNVERALPVGFAHFGG